MSLYVGDVRDGLRHFIAAGVRAQTCVTSPPYWGLRDYGTAQWAGGDEDCEHKQGTARQDGGRVNTDGFHGSAAADSDKGAMNYRGLCGDCGATRIDRQLGLEPTIAEYVANMAEVFRLVRDVLADDGTLWLNLGDSYNSSSQNNHGKDGPIEHAHLAPKDGWAGHRPLQDGLKVKDLCGIPWRVAFALQADGWYLRQDIIWAKPNPMPESVTDRCTKSHEYLFLLAKNERYFYDAAAIAEPAKFSTWPNVGAKHSAAVRAVISGGPAMGEREDAESRNRRSVWTVATQPYAEAHFATFPVALVEPCIMAGSRVGDTVLDPFMGSGTVAQVAQDLGRKWIGCELSPEYAKLIARRTAQQALLLAAD